MRKKYFNRLVDLIDKSHMDAVLIAPSEDMQFLLGHTPYLCERFQGLFVKGDGDYFYVCNLLTADEMQEVLGDKVRVYSWFDGEVFTDTVEQALKEHGLSGAKIGVNGAVRGFNMVQIAEKCGVTFHNGRPLLEELRIIKDSREVASLREAARIADEVLMELTACIEPGITEKDLKEIMFDRYKNKGAQSSYGLISCGEHTAYPHYMDLRGTVKEQDIVIFDIGCVYEEMCSDMTRTVFVGKATEEQQVVYNIVLRANLAGERAAVTGAYIPDVDLAARRVIDEADYGRYFTTRLGHGIGYGVHEAPDIKGSNMRRLQEGMAFSIEPGIYLPGKFGVRIEDIVLTTESGNEVLNKATKELITVCRRDK